MSVRLTIALHMKRGASLSPHLVATRFTDLLAAARATIAAIGAGRARRQYCSACRSSQSENYDCREHNCSYAFHDDSPFFVDGDCGAGERIADAAYIRENHLSRFGKRVSGDTFLDRLAGIQRMRWPVWTISRPDPDGFALRSLKLCGNGTRFSFQHGRAISCSAGSRKPIVPGRMVLGIEDAAISRWIAARIRALRQRRLMPREVH